MKRRMQVLMESQVHFKSLSMIENLLEKVWLPLWRPRPSSGGEGKGSVHRPGAQIHREGSVENCGPQRKQRGS